MYKFKHKAGYVFVNTNSKTQAEGIGLYISSDLEFTRRRESDISSDESESCWVEVALRKQKCLIDYWLYF